MNELMLTKSSSPTGDEMMDQTGLLDPGSLVIVLLGASAVGKSTHAKHLCDIGMV